MKYFDFSVPYTVIDVGTTKICVIIAKKLDENNFEILGIGIVQSNGLAKGMVCDIGIASRSIKQAISEAQTMAGFEPEAAYIGISGNHIKSYYSQGMVQIKKGNITQEMADEAVSSSKAIPLPEEQQILHVLPLNYTIDGIASVQNPVGMHGIRLEVSSHIITANVNAIKDLIYCCSLAGIKTQEVVLEPIASGESVLNEEEKRLGALLIDIGGGTSDVALYQNGALLYTEIISIAGNIFTNDLSVCLKTSKDEAERIKKIYGIFNDNIEEKEIEIELVNGDHKVIIPVEIINEISLSRGIELIEFVRKIINHYSPFYQIPSGIILTGGGSLLHGLPELFQEYLKISTRIGIPKVYQSYKGNLENPSFATAYGLLLYAIKNSGLNNSDSSFGFSITGLVKNIKKYVGNVFN
jgi:cell division protein FtsA